MSTSSRNIFVGCSEGPYASAFEEENRWILCALVSSLQIEQFALTSETLENATKEEATSENWLAPAHKVGDELAGMY